MRTKPSFKVGRVMVSRMGDKDWLLRYRDPQTQKDVRRRFRNMTEAEIQDMAATISHEALSMKGYLPGKILHSPAIKNGLAEAMRLSRMGATARKNTARAANQFLAWLEEHHPGMGTWDLLPPTILKEYVLYLERRGLAYDTIRLRLVPVRAAWRIMAGNHPGLVKPLPKVTLSQRPKREVDCLEPSEVAALLGWLDKKVPALAVMGRLQGLAGLRMLEAAALRRQDVDLEAGTVTVTETPLHKPKNMSSWRMIPVCREVLEALRGAIATQKIIPPGGELFVHQYGAPWSQNALSPKWTKALRSAAATLENPRLAAIMARKLRAAFATMAIRLQCQEDILRSYMGHTANSILGAYYRKITPADLKTVSARMDGWRNPASGEWQEPGTSSEKPLASQL
jgi:integrase